MDAKRWSILDYCHDLRLGTVFVTWTGVWSFGLTDNIRRITDGVLGLCSPSKISRYHESKSPYSLSEKKTRNIVNPINAARAVRWLWDLSIISDHSPLFEFAMIQSRIRRYDVSPYYIGLIQLYLRTSEFRWSYPRNIIPMLNNTPSPISDYTERYVSQNLTQIQYHLRYPSLFGKPRRLRYQSSSICLRDWINRMYIIWRRR